jgi:hypothetical protein
MIPWLAWVAPPVVGAVIGYITNDIAIKMLFRPLTEKRLFGLRLPFTPGILPRQRHKLAENIGKMVERELITEPIIRAKLESREFRAGFDALVAESINQLAATPLGALKAAAEAAPSGRASLAQLAGGLIDALAASPALAELADRAVADGLRGLAGRSLGELLGDARPAAREQLSALVDRLLDQAVEAERRDRLGAVLAERLLAFDRPIGEALGIDSKTIAARALDAAYPQLTAAALAFLRQPDTRTDLEARGRIFLRDAFHKLNVFQRLFLSAAQYDRTLAERMPEIIDDLIARIAEAAADPAVKSRLYESAGSGLDGYLAKTPADLAAAFGWDEPRLAAFLSGAVGRLLAAPDLRRELRERAAFLVDAAADRPLASVLADSLGCPIDPLIAAAQTFVRTKLRSLRGEDAARALGSLVEGNADRTVGSLVGLEPEATAALASGAAAWTLALIADRVAGILKTLDVRGLVADRIDQLDMESVERIVLDIMADQFMWINVFGAVLGGFIGLAQVALSLVLG